MSKPSRIFGREVPGFVTWLVAILCSLLILIVLLDAVNWNALRGPIGDRLTKSAGRTIAINGDLRVHLLSATPYISIDGLQVANPDWVDGNSDMANIGHIKVALKLAPLFAGKLILSLVEVDDAEVNLIRAKDERANWTFTGKKKDEDTKPFKMPAIQQLAVNNGKLQFTDAKMKMAFAGVINANNNMADQGAQALDITGDGKINGKDFKINAHGGSLLNIQPTEAYPFGTDITLGKTHIVTKGEIKPFDFGKLKTSLEISGDDLANLFYLTGLALPNTPPYKISGNIVREGMAIDFNNLKGIIGSSDINGTLHVDTSNKRPHLTAALTSKLLDFKDLAALTGAPPAGGNKAGDRSPEQKAAAAQMEAQSKLLPDSRLQVDRVRSMDADVTYKATAIKAPNGIPLQEASVMVALKNGVLKLSPVAFTLPQGKLLADITIDAAQVGAPPKVDIDARLSNVKLEQFGVPKDGSAPAPLSGNLIARAKIHGVGDSIHRAASTADGTISLVIPHGEIRQAFAELLGINVATGLGLLTSGDQTKTDLRCMVMDFKTQHGMMNLDTMVLDTGPVLATGSGTINLADETIDLRIKGEPKEPSLVRLMTPITVTGTLRHPKPGVDEVAAGTQVGIAAALSTVLTPLAAILPFLSAGLAEDADCAALVQDIKTRNGHMAFKRPK